MTLSEGKREPDYQESDLYQVALKIDGNLVDKAFYVYIDQIQRSRDELHPLGVEEIIALYKVKQGLFAQVKGGVLTNLERQGLIEKPSGASNRYLLSQPYSTLAEQEQRIGSRYLVAEVEQFVMALQGKSLRIGELEQLLSGALNRNQIKFLITKLSEDGVIVMEGVSRGTRYSLQSGFSGMNGDALAQAVVAFLRREE